MIKSLVKSVRKRDRTAVPFDRSKITNAILKAAAAAGIPDGRLARHMSDEVLIALNTRFRGGIPTVEEIQDAVVSVLMREQKDVARVYITYRQRRAEIREKKQLLFGVYDDLKLDLNATKVLSKRYLQRDENNRIIETPKQMFRRVARVIATSDSQYGGSPKQSEETFFRMMSGLDFVPNSPTLMNAGTRLGNLSACFVLPVEDSLEGIFDTLKNAAVIHQSGGGTGFSFSRLRPRGDVVKSTMSVASGPVSFMRIYDAMTDTIKQGGRRRGANMGILRCDHPDVVEFINCKADGGMQNFNISVAATDAFMKAVQKDDDYDLINPRNGEVARTMPARTVFDIIVRNAWKTGDPGLVFIDRMNKENTIRDVGLIEATNPCGEVPLLPFESCNLGSLNLSRFIDSKGADFDWGRLRTAVREAVHFLDNVIDANTYPLKQIDAMSKSNRRIGLGVMGWADALILLGIRYDTKEALSLADRLMRFINDEALKASVELAEKRGSFPNFAHSTLRKEHKHMRNVALTTIAPTGTISIIAGCSSGIEPLFAVSFYREVMEKTKLLETNKAFEKVAIDRGFYSRDLMEKIAHGLSIQKMSEIPKDVREVFVTAHDIPPEWHVRMQAEFQKHVDNAVSKTVNLPFDAKPSEVEDVYMAAYRLGVKGITVFRYGSKAEQVLYVGRPGEEPVKRGKVVAGSEFSGYCSSGTCTF
ncbi:Vitamin B12-dependent ribonucleoside-diphosphate reductase [uncultured archaeon]|nr:Vitamin B12-dependent ribonucleoside-diphosphate reductase [uncultured archaeon]